MKDKFVLWFLKAERQPPPSGILSTWLVPHWVELTTYHQSFSPGCQLLDFSRRGVIHLWVHSREQNRGSIHFVDCVSESNLLIPLTHTFIFLDPVITPVLNVNVVKIETDRHITLRCISFNGSLPITYTFFEKNIAISPAIPKYVREPAEFNVTKNSAGEMEEYRCKAKNELPDHTRYSQPILINPQTGKGYGSSFHRIWICFQKLQLLLPSLFPCWPSASKFLSFGRFYTNSDWGFLSAMKRKKTSLETRSEGDLVWRLPHLTVLPAWSSTGQVLSNHIRIRISLRVAGIWFSLAFPLISNTSACLLDCLPPTAKGWWV